MISLEKGIAPQSKLVGLEELIRIRKNEERSDSLRNMSSGPIYIQVPNGWVEHQFMGEVQYYFGDCSTPGLLYAYTNRELSPGVNLINLLWPKLHQN